MSFTVVQSWVTLVESCEGPSIVGCVLAGCAEFGSFPKLHCSDLGELTSSVWCSVGGSVGGLGGSSEDAWLRGGVLGGLNLGGEDRKAAIPVEATLSALTRSSSALSLSFSP